MTNVYEFIIFFILFLWWLGNDGEANLNQGKVEPCRVDLNLGGKLKRYQTIRPSENKIQTT